MTRKTDGGTNNTAAANRAAASLRHLRSSIDRLDLQILKLVNERASLAAFASIAPLYGKVALPGDALVHFETFIDGGLGAAWTETDATHGVRPMIAGGIGQRIFLNDSFALTARVGGNLYAEQVNVDGRTSTHAMGFWTLTLGVSTYFGGGR